MQLHTLALIVGIPVALVALLGLRDFFQVKQAIRRNFPVIGHFRYLLEMIRPEINQYFIESDTDGTPFNRVLRSIVYQRAKRETETIAFGTKLNMYAPGYEWINHSLSPATVDPAALRVTVGNSQCSQPYSASIFNISAMSYGSLSSNAILALNCGAKLGGFAHDTGEGGLSPYHLQPGGDIVWEIGTGYFSCRTKDGRFDADRFREKATLPNIKMVELKLSQGAKPSHGGILPAAKVTPEIAEIRGVPMGKDVISPPAHKEFSTPIGLLEFINQMRQLSGGKPAGFKLCIGKRREFLAICKAMIETKIIPDFVTLDGSEGGTGAAPLEFANHVGRPLIDALVFIHNALVGLNLRDQIKIIVSGKIVTGFDIVAKCAIGADICNSARGMMLALGCIQALRCNTNQCPTGVATQDPRLTRGLVVPDKAQRVFNFHRGNVHTVAELIGSMGISHTRDLRPWHIHRRTSHTETKHYGELFNYIEQGSLLGKDIPQEFERALRAATARSFSAVEDLENGTTRLAFGGSHV
jgi:glutamate synthase domain-containing protein 2